MAGGASSSTTSSSFSASDYNAFLSFRGEDTRYGFTGNLYSALDGKGIFTFFDDKELRIGNEIGPSLLNAIERSRTAIVVLSKDYASSSFCLDELVKIMESVHGQGRLVIPIFYLVAPTDVRHLTGTYGHALNKHEKKFKAKKDKLDENMERLERWKMALKQIAGLSGYHFKHGNDYEYKYIANIVEQVSRQIRRHLLPTVDHPVGLVSHVQKVTKLLDLGSDDIRMVGIHGIGGVGKTALAVAVYNAIADSVEHLSFQLFFVGDIRENSERRGLPHLQKIVLSELFGEKRKFTCVKQGISMLKQKLEGKKILLVLDDVDQEEQLKALAGESNWFGRGSRVIVTTRDISLLSSYEDKITYELETLNEKDAIELLSLKALKTNQVDSSFMNVLKEAVTYASGLPLALEVIGSNLVGKSIDQWKSALDQYKSIPNKEIQNILKVSFDALEEFEKEIFLDIACCLKGYGLKDVKEILCAHHSVGSPDHALSVLVNKSLIKTHVGWKGVTLHDLIQDMGREIVRQKSPKIPGKRSRLWHLQDIVQVFERNQGTYKIEMIHMDFPVPEKVINWNGEAFKKMTNIRTLIIERACFSQGPKLLPDSLRVLKWQQYPSHSLPDDFHSEGLVICQLSGCSLMSVEFLHRQKFESLTVINFDRSNVEKTPDVSGVPNLKELTFSACRNLIEVHESVGFLDKLELLNARGCQSLSRFPSIRLTNLKHLRLEWCSSLKNFPEILREMENIVEIDVHGTSIKEFPSSIAYLSKLRRLTVGNSATTLRGIAMLPCLEELHFWPRNEVLQFPILDEGEEQRSSMLSPNGIKVTLSRCKMSDEHWPVLVAWFRNVVELDLSWNNFTVLPKSIQELCSLRLLNLTGCGKLKEIIGIPPNMNGVLAAGCISLTSSSKMMLLNEEFHKDGNKFVHLPGSSIPEWFEYNTTESITIIEWLEDIDTDSTIEFWCRNKVTEFCLCVIGDNYDPDEGISLCLDSDGYLFEFSTSVPPFLRCIGAEHISVIGLKRKTFDHDNMDEFLSENEWNHVECYFYPIGEPMRRETRVPMRLKIGVHVINHKSSIEDDIQFSDPEDHPSAENSLKDCVSNSVAQIGISSTTNNVQVEEETLEDAYHNIDSNSVQSPRAIYATNSLPKKCLVLFLCLLLIVVSLFGSTMWHWCFHRSYTLPEAKYDQAVLYHPKKVPEESSPAAGFAKTQNTEAQRSILSSGKISGQELHLNTMLPTTIDESVRGQLEPTDDDAEMEAFYSSLDAGSYVLSHSHDHSARSVTSEKAKEALKILQGFIIKDPSFLVDPKQYTTFKSSLDYLSNLSASDDGFSGEMRALISEASRMFTHSSGDYIEASMKIESTSSELLKADELEAGMEDNSNQFKKIVALEKELLQKLVYLEESKKELEKQINAIEASISASQSEQSMTREKKRDIFNEGKTLKTQISEFRGKVTHLQHEQDVARETQAKITAEWSELGGKFKKIVVE